MAPSATNDHILSQLTAGMADQDHEETSEWMEAFDQLVETDRKSVV